MGIKSCLKGITTAAVVISWCCAMAVEVTTDTTVSLTADSDTDYEIADGVTLTIDTTGVTNVLSGRITGTGTAKLRKTGLGTLALSNANNDIPGGIDITQGTIRADAQGCLGDGEIRITQGATPLGRVSFNAQGAVFSNNFTATGSFGSKRTYYAIYAQKSVILNGGITATANGICIGNDAGATVTMNGDANATSRLLFLRAYDTLHGEWCGCGKLPSAG